MKIFLAFAFLIKFSTSVPVNNGQLDNANLTEFMGSRIYVPGEDLTRFGINSDNTTIFEAQFAPHFGVNNGQIMTFAIWTSVNTAKLVFFHGKTYEERTRFDLSQAPEILKHDKFDNERPTVLYLHGYLENLECESIHVIVDAYLQRNDHNIIVLDWSKLAYGLYFMGAVPNLQKLSDPLSDSILDLINAGLDINKLHVVGHSLGGQLAGATAKHIKEKSNKALKLRRISALDPAFPGFYPQMFYNHIDKYDAKFVDVIHTNGAMAGAPISTGTVDFWPNSGEFLQPGCMEAVCSHHRSWRYWAESVASKDGEQNFPAVKCTSWSDFKTGRCDEDNFTYMGIACPTTVVGDYYLETNKAGPYAKGTAGMDFY
ncbi:hypothetical protein PVAND_017084 [Polypedilum vanderplanki]|uniref:Lipase domain-containing protein n=1 Tax=Polypedilum vanderplanki TaxID=319348 RepID=A0A9J6BID5_POLVA|nr:hypothetical protein PVAND_017084 [Polypedilum vanderplanki]